MTKKSKKMASGFDGEFSRDRETLARQVFEDVRNWRDEAARPIIERAVAMHHDGEINLFELVETEYFQSLEGFDFFNGQHFFCEVIPLLSGSTDQMMLLVDTLVKKAGDDLAANQPNSAFVTWCKQDVQRAQSIVEAAEMGEELACRHVTFAFVAAEDAETARLWLSKFDDERQLCAITALGRITYAGSDEASESLRALAALAKKDHRDMVLSNVLASAMSICSSLENFTFPSLDDIVTYCSQCGDDHTKFQCARVLWQFGGSLAKRHVQLFLKALGEVNPEHKGTLREVDLALAELFTAGYCLETASYFEKLASDVPDAVDSEVFSSFLREVFGADPISLGNVMSTWLHSGTAPLCECLASALGDPGLRPPEIDLSGHFSSLDEVRELFVCRKAVGFLFFVPEVAVAFLVAAARVAKDEVLDDLTTLLFDPVAINYGGVAPDMLSRILEDDPAHAVVEDVLKKHQQYREGLGVIGEIKELFPTETQRQLEWQRNQEMMRDAHKEAFKKSVFLDLVNHSTLLYGRTSQIFAEGPGGERRATEVALQEHSTSIEIPRLQIFDPFGLERVLLIFRNEQIKS